jgi:ankyrin repeat protein
MAGTADADAHLAISNLDTAAHMAVLEEVRSAVAATPTRHTRTRSATKQPALKVKCNVNAVGPSGSTPLMMACTQGGVDDVRALLAAGANPSLEGDEWLVADPSGEKYREFPLSLAAVHNHVDILKLLLSVGVDVNQRTTDTGSTPLHCGCLHGHLEVVRTLLQPDGVDVNAAMDEGGPTPFGLACDNGHTDVVRLLLAHKSVDANKVRQDDGCSPLYNASEAGHTDVVRLLLAHNVHVNMNVAEMDTGNSPLYIASENGHVAVVELLLAYKGVNVNQAESDHSGQTPLHAACKAGHVDVVKLLLAHCNIAVNSKSFCDATPLYEASFKGCCEIVRALLVQGATRVINQPCTLANHTFTPLQAASIGGHLTAAQLLLVFGADTSIEEEGNKTLQEITVQNGHSELAEWFGAVAGWSPLRVAAGCRLHRDVVVQLQLGMLDPDAMSWPEVELARAAAVAPPTELVRWRNALDVCPFTVQLITAATCGWTPVRHWLYHAGVRNAVHAVLHVGERLHQRSVNPPVQRPYRCGREVVEPVEMVTLSFLNSHTNSLSASNGMFGGKYKWIADNYNRRKLYRKVTDTEIWLWMSTNGMWQICSSEGKDANSSSGVSHSTHKNDPSMNGKWLVWSGKSYSENIVTATHTTEVPSSIAAPTVLPILPPEMWIAVVGFFLRSQWTVAINSSFVANGQ